MSTRIGPVGVSPRDRVGSGGPGAGVAVLGAILLLALTISAAHWALAHWYVAVPALILVGCAVRLGLKPPAHR